MKDKEIVIGFISAAMLASALPAAAAEIIQENTKSDLSINIDAQGRPSIGGEDVGKFISEDVKGLEFADVNINFGCTIVTKKKA